MSNTTGSSSSKTTWLIAIVAAIIVLVSILVGIFLLLRSAEPNTAATQMTPVIGGTTAPTATPIPVKSDPTDEAVPPAAALAVGAVAVVASQDGLGIRVYSDARGDALVMDLYPDGAEFTVLEPSGEYDEYPVEQNGAQWVRVRTADGLVGWADVSELAPIESE